MEQAVAGDQHEPVGCIRGRRRGEELASRWRRGRLGECSVSAKPVLRQPLVGRNEPGNLTEDFALRRRLQRVVAERRDEVEDRQIAPRLEDGFAELADLLDPALVVGERAGFLAITRRWQDDIGQARRIREERVLHDQEIGGAKRPLHEFPVGIGHQGVASDDIERAHSPPVTEVQHGVEIRARFRRDFGAPGPFETCARRIIGDRAQPRQRRRQNPHVPGAQLIGTVEEELHRQALAERAENLQQVVELLQRRARFRAISGGRR